MVISAVIDRFEGDAAVLLVGDDEEEVLFPRSCLPEELGDGDYIKIEINYDVEATRAAMEESRILLDEISGGNT